MYINQTMLENIERYVNYDNKDIIQVGMNIYKIFKQRNWWQSEHPGDVITTFTPSHEIKVSKKAVTVNRLPEPIKFNYTILNNKVFIEHDGWWLPAKIFIDLPDLINDECSNTTFIDLPFILKQTLWLIDTDCAFRCIEGQLQWWYLLADLPFKKIRSRAIGEIKARRYFNEKYNIDVDVTRFKGTPGINADVYIYNL